MCTLPASSSTCEYRCCASITLADNDSACPSLNSTTYSLVSSKGFSCAVPIGLPSASRNRVVRRPYPCLRLLPLQSVCSDTCYHHRCQVWTIRPLLVSWNLRSIGYILPQILVRCPPCTIRPNLVVFALHHPLVWHGLCSWAAVSLFSRHILHIAVWLS